MAYNPAHGSQKRIWHIALLLLAGTIVYSNSFHVPFILDDHVNLNFVGQKSLLEHLLHGSSRRVTDISFALNYRVHGLQVAGYHLVNLVIHLANIMLLYYFIISVIRSLHVSYSRNDSGIHETSTVEHFIPFATALLFAVHPVQTQAVTYIIQRYTSLATFFYLLSSLFYIRARRAFLQGGTGRNSLLPGIGAFVAALLAAGSKQIAFTLPFMLLVLEIFLFRGRLFNRRFYLACGALFIIVLAVVAVVWHGSSLDVFLFDLRHATTEDQYTPRTTYVLTQTRVVATYLGLLCLPIGQNLMHDAPIYSHLFLQPVLVSVALHCCLITFAVILFRISEQSLVTDKRRCGVCQRLASLGIFWFYGAMAVESSIIPIRDVMFEHRMYLPSVGFFMTITALFALALQDRRTGMRVLQTLLAVVCIGLGSMTIARNRVWNDPLALWQDVVNKSPDKWLALLNLAGEYMAKNMPEKALPLYVRTMELNPNEYIRFKVCVGTTMKALNIYESRYTTGEEFLLPGRKSGDGDNLDYKNMYRWDAVFYNNMGLAYEYLKEPNKAIDAYKFALTKDPAYDLPWYNLALLTISLGDKVQATEAVRKLQTLNPARAGELSSVLAH